MKAILIETDGLDITCTEFQKTEDAVKTLQQRYNNLMPFPQKNYHRQLSYLSTMDARLMTEEETYLWKIIEVE